MTPKLVPCLIAVLAALVPAPSPADAQEFKLQNQTVAGTGWRPWYEVKADPENPQNVIVCGTKYDSGLDSFAGFVSATKDGGASWQEVLSDTSTTWVSEQSCAFGPHHTAYFISEASKVVDGETHHELGTTRVYVSRDGGQHWLETLKTAWADASTSAVNQISGSLYTFFNSGPPKDQSPEAGGTSIGLLVFAADGKSVAGPVFDSVMRKRKQYGTYPSQAVALKSGVVVALYGGLPRPPATESEFGVIRALPSPKPVLESIVISHTQITSECPWIDHGSIAYDSARDRLYVLYGDACQARRLMLASSDDEGRSWSAGVPVTSSGQVTGTVYYPTLRIDSQGNLVLLWRNRHERGDWFVAPLRNHQLVEPVTRLSQNNEGRRALNNDSLWTSTFPSGRAARESATLPDTLMLTVLNMEDRIWRDQGLAAIGDHLLAVWPFAEDSGSGLHASTLATGSGAAETSSVRVHDAPDLADRTVQARIFYGGLQHFDQVAGNLKICLTVANRGDTPMRVPVRLEATSVSSPAGKVSILNASNGLAGIGAMWDVSQAIPSGQILPQASSQPFCLAFHLEAPGAGAAGQSDASLLILRIRVLTGP